MLRLLRDSKVEDPKAALLRVNPKTKSNKQAKGQNTIDSPNKQTNKPKQAGVRGKRVIHGTGKKSKNQETTKPGKNAQKCNATTYKTLR